MVGINFEDWEQRKLSDLMIFSNGINAPKENYGKGKKMISVMDILADEPLTYKKIRNSVEIDNEMEKNNKVEHGDLIFVRSSEVVSEVGLSKAYLEYKYALYSGFTIRGKKKVNYNPRFIELSLNVKNRKEIERKAGGSTRYNISQKILNEINIFTPDLNEENKIGDFITKLDDTIALHQDKLVKLKQLNKGYLQVMFPQKEEKAPRLRFANFSQDWEQRKLREVIESELKGKAKAEMTGSENAYLETNYLNGGEITYVNSPSDVDKDDVIILWDGSQAGTVYHGFKGALGSTLKAYKPKESGEFIYHFLKRNQQKIYNNYRTPNIPHVVKTFIDEFYVSIPIFDEQQRISSLFEQLDYTITLHQKKISTLQEIKKIYLQKMFA